ncbi:hypothetical protein V1264_023982 [Littorina saxatilis]|uniref:Uncharacterized protein n=1 Tax=Littorina saxatilis TaxID=31220 RepID=A0AAN9B9K5_9CAEN
MIGLDRLRCHGYPRVLSSSSKSLVHTSCCSRLLSSLAVTLTTAPRMRGKTPRFFTSMTSQHPRHFCENWT